MSDKTLGERMAAVETWVEGHEERCEERLASIGRELRDIKAGQADQRSDFKAMQRTAWGVILSLAAWGLVQIYSDLKRPPPAPAAVVAVNPAPTR